MADGKRVVVIGDALIDEIRDEHGVREFVGGAALNVAVGLARLGVPTSLIAMVGDDEPGAHIRSYLADFGVKLLASPSIHGSSRAVSTRDEHGEPVYEFNQAAQNRTLRFGEAETTALAEASMAVVSCYPFDDVSQTLALAQAIEAAGVPLAVDPNPREAMMTDRAEFVRGFESLAARSELVKIGDDDATLLYGEPLDALRAKLVDMGVDAVLATQGRGGAAIEAGEVVVTAPISDLPGRVVDTMGAGDAVLAATAARVADGMPETEEEWADVLSFAMDVAAATVRFEGALLRLPESLKEDDLDRLGT